MSRTRSGAEPGVGETLPDQPERLAQRAGGCPVRVRPQVGGDRLPGARPAGQHEQGEEGLGVPAGEPDGPAIRRPRIEPAEQVDPEPDGWTRDDGRHRRSDQWRTSGPPHPGPDVQIASGRAPRPVATDWPRGMDVPRPIPRYGAMMSERPRSGESCADSPGVGKPTASTLATLIATVPIAVLTFQFDPYAQLFGDLVVRWGTIALVGVIVTALVLAGLLARAGGLRADDVAFVAVGHRAGCGHRRPARLPPPARGRSTPAPWTGCSIRRSAGWSSGWPSSAGSSAGAYVASLLGGVGRPLAAPGGGPGPVRPRGRQADHGPDRRRARACRAAELGDRLPRRPGRGGRSCRPCRRCPSQAIEGVATLAILAVLTVVAHRSGRSGAATARCSSRRSGCGRSPGRSSRPPGGTRS